jgi:hypothetical protein
MLFVRRSSRLSSTTCTTCMPFGEPLAKGLLMKVLWQSDQQAAA